MLAEPRHEPKVRQGVTTELIGVDGNAYAPFPHARRPADFADPQRRPRRPARHRRSTGRRSPSTSPGTTARRRVNVAYIVGNSPAPDRGHRLGRGRGRRAATRRPARDAARGDGGRARSGCRRASTTRRAPTPRPAELAALWPRRARSSAASTTRHVRYPLGDGFLDPFREAIEIGRRGGVARPHHALLPSGDVPGPARGRCSRLVDDARAEGLDVTFDLYPYEWSSTRLLIMLPTWIQAGGVGPLKERLADGGTRARIRDEMTARGRLFAGDRSWDALRLGAFTRPEHLAWEGRTLGDVMRDTGRDAVDAICDLLLAEDLRVNQVTPGPHIDGIRAVPRAPAGDDRDRRRADRGQALAAHVRLVPADPRPVRARGAAARASRTAVHRMTGMPRGAPRPPRPRRARGRPRRGPRPVRPGDRPHPGDLRRAAAVPRSGSRT